MSERSAADADVLRHLYPRVLAKTLARTRNLPDAEDAVQEAFAAALERWPSAPPRSAEAWLVTVASRRFYDKVRRDRRHSAVERLAALSPWARIALGEPAFARAWKDDLLRLLFACCHPALEPGESAALTLSTVVGLSVRELAAAFDVAPRSMEQRLTRARSRLRERGSDDPDDVRDPTPADIGPDAAPERLDRVLRVVYLLFNEGYWSVHDATPIRADLCRLAIGLARSLHEAFPEEPEAGGLLALVLLHDARRAARLDRSGHPVPLPDQDRARWDHDAIAAATAVLDQALARQRPGPYQIEAALAAVHCSAPTAEATDWTQIAALYALLESHRPTPSVRVNRAFAVGRAHGPGAGLALLEPDAWPAGWPELDESPYVHAVRGALLQELGRHDDARKVLERAIAGARNEHERSALAARLASLGP